MTTPTVSVIDVQLDYHPSAQYAGIHKAISMGLFTKAGLQVVLTAPGQHGGDEPQLVVEKQSSFDRNGKSESIAIGMVEQNVLIPAISHNFPVKAFASIFQSTPLALAALPGTKLDDVNDLNGLKVGMHIDSTELMKTILSHSTKLPTTEVVTVDRDDKVNKLLAGDVAAIQVYDSTEVVQLTETLGGKVPSVITLQTLIDKAGLPFPLGYSQVLFAPCSVLDREEARKSLRLFLELSCEGWRQCVLDAELATTAIMIGRKSLGYPNEVPGVFDESSSDFQRKSLTRNLAYVAGSPSYTPDSFLESHYIDSTRWQEASNAMASTGFVYGIVPFVKAVDTRVWSKPVPPTIPSSTSVTEGKAACEIPCGLTLARKIRSDVSKRSTAFLAYNGRRPQLAVINFGTAANDQRMEAFSAPQDSWWTKQNLCSETGIVFKSIVLPMNASISDLVTTISALNEDNNIDAIMVERNAAAEACRSFRINAISSLISAAKDVDGEKPSTLPGAFGKDVAAVYFDHFVVTSAAVSSEGDFDSTLSAAPAMLPCTVGGVLYLLDHYRYSDKLPGSTVVVIGRSRKLSIPLAMELMRRDATVTVCHSKTTKEELARLCRQADFLFVAAGSPHLVTPDMVKPGAGVINIGTTYTAAAAGEAGSAPTLMPDVHPDVATVAGFMTPTPHGVGPLCAAVLCYNTLALAEARLKANEALDIKPARTTSWERKMCSKTNSPFLAKIVRCRDFSSAVRFIQEVETVAQRLDHHPTLHVNSRRVCEREEGCDVAVELNTYSTRSITEEDFILADAIDKIAAAM